MEDESNVFQGGAHNGVDGTEEGRDRLGRSRGQGR